MMTALTLPASKISRITRRWERLTSNERLLIVGVDRVWGKLSFEEQQLILEFFHIIDRFPC